MSEERGFIAHLAPTPATPETIANEPFFPAVDLAAMRESLRLDGTVTPTRLRDAVSDAILHVNNELRPWAEARQAEGAATLADLLAPRINGTSTRVQAYLRAVQHGAAASLEDTKRAQATLPAGLGKDARVLESVGLRTDDHLQAMRHAIADCMGRMRESVQLI